MVSRPPILAAPSSRLPEAMRLFEAARFAQAEALARRILAGDPGQVGALNVLGLALLQQGRADEAVAALEKVVAQVPGEAGALANLGSALQAAGRGQQALAAMRRAAEALPGNADLRYNYANALRGAGCAAEAVEGYGEALALQPDHLDALGNRGDVLRLLGRREEALADFTAAVRQAPFDARMRFNRAVVLQELGRTADAEVDYRHALELQPGYAEAALNLALTLKQTQRGDEALAWFDRAIHWRPDFAEALQARGNLLLDLERLPEALDNIDRALRLDPGSVDGLLFRGGLLRRLDRPAEAVAAYDRALQVEPHNQAGLINRSAALLAMNDVDAALAGYRRASALCPDDSMAHWNEALCLLLKGDLAEGWPKYEWRWKRWAQDGVRNGPIHDDGRTWTGQADLAGRTFLLHAEQGIGDTIQFCRYAPLLALRGARVILEVQPALIELCRAMPGVAEAIEMSTKVPAFDWHAPMLSMPLAFGTTLETIPARVPYLAVDDAQRQRWRQRLGPGQQRPRVGLAWRGNPGYARDAARSMALERLAPLRSLGVQWVALQKDIVEADRPWVAQMGLRTFEQDLRDFSDTAALIGSLDLVISVDTAVAHLAGGLARPVWILLPFAPDWRWMLGRPDSPWYPTARLFRQPSIGDWGSVVQQLAVALRDRFGAP